MSGGSHAHEADSLYRRLGETSDWASCTMDAPAWDRRVARLSELRSTAPALTAMLGRGALVAAAYQSGALDRLYDADEGLAGRLAGGTASLADITAVTVDGVDVVDHVRANLDALAPGQHGAGDPTEQEIVSQSAIRRIHDVACSPQVTHRVPTAVGDQDHVLAHGDYKHHPNHRRRSDGTWEAAVPLAGLEAEMARLVAAVSGDGFRRLHPIARAAFVHHAVTHVAPFADGNGRVARAMAGRHLLAATGLPLLVRNDQATAYGAAQAAAEHGQPGALVAFCERSWSSLVDDVDALVATAGGSAEHTVALARWSARAEAAEQLVATLVGRVEAAVARYRRRSDLRWLAHLDEAVAVARSPGLSLRIATVRDGTAVEEHLTVDAHPALGDAHSLWLTAEEAQLGLEVRWTEGDDDGDRLDAWLDRVVSALALRSTAAGDEV